jgi:hypothetical protein
MGIRHVSLADLWAAWSVYWIVILGFVLWCEGPKDFRGAMGSFGLGAGAGSFAGALFGGGMWLIIKVKYG